MQEKPEFPKAFTKTFLYNFFAGFTIFFVVVYLAAFHLKIENIQQEFWLFWAIGLPGYVVVKEISTWTGNNSKGNHRGEILALIIVGGLCWMFLFNTIRVFIFNEDYLPIPEGYFGCVIEAVIVWVISYGSSIVLYLKRTCVEKDDQQK